MGIAHDIVTSSGVLHAINGGLTWGMTLRAIHAVDEKSSAEPEWMAAFLLSLERDDLAPATVRGYRYDLRHFLAWRRTVQDGAFVIQDWLNMT